NQATAQKAAQAATPAPAAAPAQAAAPAPAAPAQAAAPAPAAPVVQKSPVALAPQVGDVRVRFRIIRPHKISIAAAQKGDTFTSYIASNDEKVLLMVNGEKSAAEMFTSAEKSNAIWTWVLRLVGFLLMKAGFGTILHPLSVLADVVPFIGNIVEVGTGLISALFAFPLSLVVIAVAWLFYRPLLAIVLLAIVIGCVVLLVMKLKAKKAPVPAPAA
ncbi:MAG: TMEM43 family protein, partial [Victivallales bacterium]|nr:TMEM43 family protein [Victivallales bacterium]